MQKYLALLKQNDDEQLLSLKTELANDILRISYVQQVFGWGYNRSLRAVERALSAGVLKEAQDRGVVYHYVFVIH